MTTKKSIVKLKPIGSVYDMARNDPLIPIIIKDLGWLGFANITMHISKESLSTVFHGFHTDPNIQAELEKATRTDLCFTYSLDHGQLRRLAYSTSSRQSSRNARYNWSAGNVAFHIAGYNGGYGPDNLEIPKSFIMRKRKVKHSDIDFTEYYVVWESPDVAELQEAKRLEIHEANRKSHLEALKSRLYKMAEQYGAFLESRNSYEREYPGTLPEIITANKYGSNFHNLGPEITAWAPRGNAVHFNIVNPEKQGEP